MNKFLERLQSRDVLVSDGATGTNLQRMGLKPGTPPEDLVMDQPDWLLTLAEAFVAAGSDIILTCTFGGTRVRMKDSKYVDRAPEVNKRAVELARKAAAAREGVMVAGSMGPTGLLMPPYGPLEPADAVATYAEQARALTEGGVDLLLIETMFAPNEADAAFDGARSASDLPIVMSFSYDRGVRTMMGTKPVEVMNSYKDKGAAVIGANCGMTLDHMETVVQEYAALAPGFPLWIKPNAGLPHLEGVSAVYDINPQQMGDFAARYVAAGARIVGGCCGSTPEHVAAIVKAVKQTSHH